jgi:hypothetical protein
MARSGPMPGDEFIPCCFSTSVRRRLNTVLLQNVVNGPKCKEVAEIGQRSLNSTIAPASILLCHSSNQRNDLSSNSWSSGRTVRAPVVFLGDQCSMPRQESLGSHDSGDLTENRPGHFLCLCCQPATLVVAETHSVITNLFSKDSIFLYNVCDDMLLILVQPTGEGHDEKRKWIQSSAHGAGNYRPECRLKLQSFQSDRVLARDVKQGFQDQVPDVGAYVHTQNRLAAVVTAFSQTVNASVAVAATSRTCGWRILEITRR